MSNFRVNKRDLLSSLVKENIIEYIKEKNLNPGDKLPSEMELTKMFNVSRLTLREAMAQLAQEGVVYKIQGKGTFIRQKPLMIKSGLETLDGVTEVLKSFNYEPTTQYIKVEISEPSEEQVKELRLNSSDKVITYYRKRYANNKFAVYSESTVPIKIFKGDIPKYFPKESMLQYFEEDLGILVSGAIAEIQPFIFNKKMAKILDIKEDTLYLLLKQTIYDYSNLPIIYSLDYYDTKFFKFFINRRRGH